MFGFAMTHGFIEMARDALALFQKSYRVNSNRGYQGYAIPISGQMSGDQPHLLTNVPKADLARIPFHVMFALQCTQERVLLHGSMWPEAKMIKVSSPRFLRFLPSLPLTLFSTFHLPQLT